MDSIKLWFEAKNKARKYGNLVSLLESKISEIQSCYDDAYNNLDASNQALTSNENSAEGLVMTDFVTHEENWVAKYEKILNNITTGLESLDLRKEEAEQLQSYWLEVAQAEEAKFFGGF